MTKRPTISAAGELHGRAVSEWIGKTPDTPVPQHVALRVLLRQNRKCAITGRTIRAGDKTHTDHIKRLKDGGENRETNLQIVLIDPHKQKSAKEEDAGAKVDRIQRKHYGLKKQSEWSKRYQWQKQRSRFSARQEDA